MEYLSYGDITVYEDLAYRLQLNYTRMEGPWYKPDIIFTADFSGWPADWEGRTMLSLVLLAQATGRQPAYLERIWKMIQDHFNEKGYFGPIHPAGKFDEQQFSGHNWLTRAILEYYHWKKDETVLPILYQLIDNLYLPALGYYKDYPTDPSIRIGEGKAAGELTGKDINGWIISSDIGCAFMCLDCLSQVYEDLKYEKIRPLLEEMIVSFANIDFVKASMHTHATLSAARGITRFYRATGDKKYLALACKIFDLYKKEGMCETYANQNWFHRPVWTEPCAVVDSYILASYLYAETKEETYLDMAHRIFFNSHAIAQRPNGGFGCDGCAGAEGNVFWQIKNEELYEAYWCCTMRGSEGLSFAEISTAASEGSDFYVLHPRDCHIENADIRLEIRTLYPLFGKISFIAESKKYQSLKIYVPAYLRDAVADLTVNGKETRPVWNGAFLVFDLSGEPISVSYTLTYTLRREKLLNESSLPGYHTVWAGPLMLGIATEEETSGAAVLEDQWIPLFTLVQQTEASFKASKLQVLFRD